MALQDWALPRLQKLLPLDDNSLRQVITYSDTLPKQAASEHLKNLLGDSGQALEFISSFNLRRPLPPSEPVTPNPGSSSASRDVSESEVLRSATKAKRKKQPFNKLPPPRQIEDHGDLRGAYKKKDEGDYMASLSSKSKIKEPQLSNTLSLKSEPDARQLPFRAEPQHSPRLPPSASGPLISDLPGSKPKSKAPSQAPSRTSSPASQTSAKLSLPSATSPRGASTTLSDLESAIRTLELQTNPTLYGSTNTTTSADGARRKCMCQAQRHPLLASAPNCLSCGKIVCAYEGLGPCTFCGMPLLSRAQINDTLRVLKEERGKERMQAHNAAHTRPEASRSPRAFATPASSGPASDAEAEADSAGHDGESKEELELARAKAQRDRLLSYQSQNTKRTTVRDEAADYETPSSGLSAWASPAERALQLKKQQKVLREQEWNSKGEWEKRRVVVSLEVDSRGRGKAVRRMAEVDRPEEGSEHDDGNGEGDEEEIAERGSDGSGSGNFAKNPLLGELIRPVYNRADEKGKGKHVEKEKRSTWRRVQDDSDDNEQWILDGGAYGDLTDGRVLAAEEHPCG